jgi:protein-disulfide isomerase
MSDPNQTKKERRDAARADREAAEASAAASAARKRRLSILGGIVAAVAVVVVVVIVASSGGGDSAKPQGAGTGAGVAGAAESRAMLTGVPQAGLTLGDPKAPVTMLEFADLQCPYCQEYSLQTMPRIVQDYVRTGKVKMELHLLTFLGPDSIRGAQVANLAAEQNRLWHFADLFYFNQGKEQTGYATDAFLKKLAGAVPGLDSAKLFAAPISDTPTAKDAAADALASKYGVTGTPTFVIGKTGGTLSKVDGFDYDSVKAAIDAALPQS